MYHFLILSVNLPFTVSLMIVILITFIELIGLVLGTSLTHLLEHQFHLEHAISETSDLCNGKSLFAWFGVGRVPIAVLLILAFLLFGLIGLTLEAFAISLIHIEIYSPLAAIIAIFIGLPLLRYLSIKIAKIIPMDESDAVSENDLIGKTATISLGNARHGKPAQAKVKLNKEQTLYVMVEPDNCNETFMQNERVLIVKKGVGKYFAINSSSIIDDKQ